jgi:lipid-binding SYLF domain-containing protein
MLDVETCPINTRARRRRSMNNLLRAALAAVILVLFTVPAAPAGKKDIDEVEVKRQSIDAMALETLETLFAEKPDTRTLYDKAAGYAVFDNFKVALLLSGGGGVGVAVDKSSGARTYMKMGTGGVGLGLGGQSYQVVFFFESAERFHKFVEKGWQADAAANAAAGTIGKNAVSSFTDGLAVFQLTNKGLMAQADVSGTKYWKAKKLNRR